MKFSLIPREEQFFDLLEQAASYMVEAARVLHTLSTDFAHLKAHIDRIGGIEHACDEVAHITLDRLEQTFITPLDREDIHALIVRLDDVVDMINTSATRFTMFRVSQPRPPVSELTAIILKQSEALSGALGRLREPKQHAQVTSGCIEVHRLENEADDLTKRIIGDLFEHETNAIELLRWKEIYQTLETVTDCSEDVANVVQGIVVKHA
jgi:predicted phosphate transport protein (TIGR00153 family)